MSGKAITVQLVCALAFGMAATVGTAADEEPPALSPREVVERSGPAVVVIEVDARGGKRQGSGFIVDGDGLIVTSLHLVGDAIRVTVSLSDGTRFEEPAVRAFDVEKDLAVLEVDVPARGMELPTLDLGDTSSAERGDSVLVIGSPLGLEQTVTEGIVSAWRELSELPSGDPGEKRTARVLLLPCRLLQISAVIAPGSSGGPVFNDRGEVIGVATAGILHGAAGLNFAVPVEGLYSLLDEDEAMDLVTFRERVDDARHELARPHFDSAEMAYGRDDRQEAKHHLERALLLFPAYTEALLLSGTMAMEERQFELAEQHLMAAVQADFNNAETWYLLGTVYNLMADERQSMDMLGKAETAYEKAIDLEYRHARAALSLAVIKYGQGLLDRAEELLLLAIDSEPGMIDARYYLGEVYLSRGDFNEAKNAFELALWEDQSHALSHFGLAKLYTLRDRTPHGAGPHHWEEFLRLSEGDPSLAETRQFAIRILEQYYPHLLER